MNHEKQMTASVLILNCASVSVCVFVCMQPSTRLEDIQRKYPVSGLAKRMSVCASGLLGKPVSS